MPSMALTPSNSRPALVEVTPFSRRWASVTWTAAFCSSHRSSLRIMFRAVSQSPAACQIREQAMRQPSRADRSPPA